MSELIKLGDKDMSFVYKGNELVYPNPVQDGLVLWYDFSGMSNSDTNRGVAKDLSGNGNDGMLKNFNYTEESGYTESGLKFDGVDDYVPVKNPLSYQSPESQNYSVEFVLSKNVGMYNNAPLLDGINLGFRFNYSDSFNKFRLLNYTELPANIYLYSYYDIKGSEKYYVVFSYSYKESKTSVFINGKEYEKTHPLEMKPRGMEENISLSMKDGNIYSTRIYNRPLTEQEIAHNYAIEKERFNIQEV